MRTVHKALCLTGLQLALVASLGGKLLLDRAVRPRFWLKARVVDPDLPIRGRYLDLNLEVPVRGAQLPPPLARPATGKGLETPPRREWQITSLTVRLVPGARGVVAMPALPPAADQDRGSDESSLAPGLFRASLSDELRELPPEQWQVELYESIPFFIPEHSPDPVHRAAGEAH